MLEKASVKTAPESEVVELDGTIRWFHHVKGMGFIQRNDGGGDVFLHRTCIVSSGFDEYGFIFYGSKVRFQAALGPKGWYCQSIISLEKGPNEKHRAPKNPRRILHVLGPLRMQVKWFNRKNGFGFFQTPDLAEDVFVHIAALRASGTRLELYPREFAEVTYGVDENDKLRGFKAVSVKLLS